MKMTPTTPKIDQAMLSSPASYCSEVACPLTPRHVVVCLVHKRNPHTAYLCDDHKDKAFVWNSDPIRTVHKEECISMVHAKFFEELTWGVIR